MDKLNYDEIIHNKILKEYSEFEIDMLKRDNMFIYKNSNTINFYMNIADFVENHCLENIFKVKILDRLLLGIRTI